MQLESSIARDLFKWCCQGQNSCNKVQNACRKTSKGEEGKAPERERGLMLLSKPMGKTYFLYACLHSKLFSLSQSYHPLHFIKTFGAKAAF